MNKETLLNLEKEYMSWLGTPYMHMQFEKNRGADCALFIAKCYANIGILSNVEKLYYPKNWMITGSRELMIEGYQKHLSEYLKKDYEYTLKEINNYDGKNFELKKGDILCFNSRHTTLCHHAALYHENGFLIHSFNEVGVCVAQFLPSQYKRLKFVFRIEAA